MLHGGSGGGGEYDIVKLCSIMLAAQVVGSHLVTFVNFGSVSPQ